MRDDDVTQSNVKETTNDLMKRHRKAVLCVTIFGPVTLLQNNSYISLTIQASCVRIRVKAHDVETMWFQRLD